MIVDGILGVPQSVLLITLNESCTMKMLTKCTYWKTSNLNNNVKECLNIKMYFFI